MKYILLALLINSAAFAQQRLLKGFVKDIHEFPIADVTIRVMDNVQLTAQLTTTDAKGYFQIPVDSTKVYQLTANHIQFITHQETIQDVTLSKIHTIYLYPKTNELEEVGVSGKKPRVVRKIDRLEFNIENSSLASLNSWEILKRTPLVKVIGSAISVKGSEQIMILVNDKKVMLTGDELKTMLENTAGNDIQTIEVITNPPAKYEASGSAIINIRMKQNQLQGYRGILVAKAEQSTYSKQIGGLTNYYKNRYFNIRTTYNFGRGTYARYGIDYVKYNDGTTWVSKMDRIDRNNNQQTYIFSADYTPDSSWTVSFGLDGFYSPHSKGIYRVPTSIYNMADIVESNYLTTNDHNRASNNKNLFLQVSKKISHAQVLDWSTYFTHNLRVNDQDVQTELQFKDLAPKFSHFISNNTNKTRLLSTQIDYSQNSGTIQYELGVKYSYAQTYSGLIFTDDESGTLKIRPDKSTDFNYKEHNTATYGSASYGWRKWQLKAGLRAEYTSLKGIVSQPADLNAMDYLTFFPTLYLQYEAKSQSQFGFSYGKRINRPSYSWLNPAKSYYNLFSYFQGDPRLRATIVHNLNLTYTKNNWNVDLFYRFEKWPNMEISYQEDSTHNMIYHYTNIENGQGAGVDLSKNLDIRSWWSINLVASAMYNENNFIGVDEQLYKNDVFQFNSSASSSFTLNKLHDWNMEIGNSYFSPSIQGPFRISGFSSTYFIMNRKFFKKKLEASLSVMDIFRSERVKVSSNYANQNNYFLDYQDTQKISLSLRLHVGNQTLRSTKSIQKTEEQDRL